jgi:hypothetical protein
LRLLHKSFTSKRATLDALQQQMFLRLYNSRYARYGKPYFLKHLSRYRPRWFWFHRVLLRTYLQYGNTWSWHAAYTLVVPHLRYHYRFVHVTSHGSGVFLPLRAFSFFSTLLHHRFWQRSLFLEFANYYRRIS